MSDGDAGKSPPQDRKNFARVVEGFIRRVERLDEEIEALKTDQKEVKKEAAEAGVPTKVLNELIRRRRRREKMGSEDYAEFEAQVDALWHDLSFSSTPLGQAPRADEATQA